MRPAEAARVPSGESERSDLSEPSLREALGEKARRIGRKSSSQSVFVALSLSCHTLHLALPRSRDDGFSLSIPIEIGLMSNSYLIFTLNRLIFLNGRSTDVECLDMGEGTDSA